MQKIQLFWGIRIMLTPIEEKYSYLNKNLASDQAADEIISSYSYRFLLSSSLFKKHNEEGNDYLLALVLDRTGESGGVP